MHNHNTFSSDAASRGQEGLLNSTSLQLTATNILLKIHDLRVKIQQLSEQVEFLSQIAVMLQDDYENSQDSTLEGLISKAEDWVECQQQLQTTFYELSATKQALDDMAATYHSRYYSHSLASIL